MNPRITSCLGLVLFLLLAYALSENRRRIRLRIVLWGLGLQLLIGVFLLRSTFFATPFALIKQGFLALNDASIEGATLVFGSYATEYFLSPGSALVAGGEGLSPITMPMYMGALAFRVLPVIILVSAITAVLYHFHITQAVVRAMAWLMRRTLKTSGAETVGVSLLIFLGIESVTALRQYLNTFTRSELNTLMTTFMATIAASVMVAYTNFGADPIHLLTASLMSAPAAILISKILIPETETPATSGSELIALKVDTRNVFDALTRGTSDGLQMALSVGATLIAFVGIIALLDGMLRAVTGYTASQMAGGFFFPFAFLMGIPIADSGVAGELLATKTILNEFLAYSQLQPHIVNHTLAPRSITILTYALCGFANPGSIGICMAALNTLIPERRKDIVSLGWTCFLGGTVAAFTTACVAGILINA